MKSEQPEVPDSAMPTAHPPPKIRASFIQGLCAILSALAYVIWLKAGPNRGLEVLAHFFLTTFVCGPPALIFGVLSLKNGRPALRHNKLVLLWLIPVVLALAAPALALAGYFLLTFLASKGILIQ